MSKKLKVDLEKSYNSDVTLRDMEMQEIINIMALKDELIKKVVTYAFQNPLVDMESISYRQGILEDVLERRDIVKELYNVVCETQMTVKKHFFGMNNQNLRNMYTTSLEYISAYILGLKSIRGLTDKYYSLFKSTGFKSFFEEIKSELSDEYLKEINDFINNLKSTDTYSISVDFGPRLDGVNYTLREAKKTSFSLLNILHTQSIKLKEDDEAGRKDFDYRKDLAIQEASNTLAKTVDHLDYFFSSLQSELAFYTGVVNLANHLENLGMPFCIPKVLPKETFDRSYDNLYDVALAITKKSKVDSNILEESNKRLYLISGANQGGKTTFLRSLGQAQIMAQSGILVGASKFEVPIRIHIYTHFKKEEDQNIKSGKLDEELLRMNDLINHMDPFSLVLFNESFSSTNEREGSRINKDIVDSLIKYSNEVFSVSHLYTFSHSYEGDFRVVFLIAERKEDGSRTHHLIKGIPEKTAYGIDLYKAVFK